jgi:hypothetical protein
MIVATWHYTIGLAAYRDTLPDPWRGSYKKVKKNLPQDKNELLV